jgi:hypothetical protein
VLPRGGYLSVRFYLCHPGRRAAFFDTPELTARVCSVTIRFHLQVKI